MNDIVKVTFMCLLLAGCNTAAYYKVSVNGGAYQVTTDRVIAPPGNDLFIVNAYDAKGHLISSKQFSQVIVEGVSNKLGK